MVVYCSLMSRIIGEMDGELLIRPLVGWED